VALVWFWRINFVRANCWLEFLEEFKISGQWSMWSDKRVHVCRLLTIRLWTTPHGLRDISLVGIFLSHYVICYLFFCDLPGCGLRLRGTFVDYDIPQCTDASTMQLVSHASTCFRLTGKVRAGQIEISENYQGDSNVPALDGLGNTTKCTVFGTNLNLSDHYPSAETDFRCIWTTAIISTLSWQTIWLFPGISPTCIS
jgi:hypothetical protein